MNEVNKSTGVKAEEIGWIHSLEKKSKTRRYRFKVLTGRRVCAKMRKNTFTEVEGIWNWLPETIEDTNSLE